MGGLRTFAASAKSKGPLEESGRSGHRPVFSVVQTQRRSAESLVQQFILSPDNYFSDGMSVALFDVEAGFTIALLWAQPTT